MANDDTSQKGWRDTIAQWLATKVENYPRRCAAIVIILTFIAVGTISAEPAWQKFAENRLETPLDWPTWTGELAWTTGETATFNFLRLASTIGLLGTVYHFGKSLWKAYCSSTKQSWWNIADKAKDPTWEDVRRMVVGELEPKVAEPLAFKDQRPIPSRPPQWEQLIKLVAGWVILGCSVFFGLAVIADPRENLPAAIWAEPSGTGWWTNNLTAFLALVAATISIWFGFRQFQAQVRAKSRQEWIDKLRKEIAKSIALAEEYQELAKPSHPFRRRPEERFDRAKRKADVRRELTETRLKLETRLNPSEKDHRLLMYLVQRLAMWGDDSAFERIADVKFLKESIGSPAQNLDWQNVLKPAETDDGFGTTVSHAMRLSHVILKREWEQVKTTT